MVYQRCRRKSELEGWGWHCVRGGMRTQTRGVLRWFVPWKPTSYPGQDFTKLGGPNLTNVDQLEPWMRDTGLEDVREIRSVMFILWRSRKFTPARLRRPVWVSKLNAKVICHKTHFMHLLLFMNFYPLNINSWSKILVLGNFAILCWQCELRYL